MKWDVRSTCNRFISDLCLSAAFSASWRLLINAWQTHTWLHTHTHTWLHTRPDRDNCYGGGRTQVGTCKFVLIGKYMLIVKYVL